MKTIAYTDGATYLTNPGPAGIGVWFVEPDRSLCIPLEGTLTNNVAEYRAIIEAIETWFLDMLLPHESEELEVRTDSNLVVEQVASRWHTKAKHLRPMQARVRALIKLADKAGARVTLVYVPREENKRADRISKEAAALAAYTVA